MEELLMNVELEMENVISNLEKRFTNVRAGRANASILDSVMADYYGAPTSIKHMANISIPEARQIMIMPYDKSLLGAIEKAIYESNIGLTPNNNGNSIILVIPDLTEETRKKYVKEVKGMAEDARIALRNIRQDAMNTIKKSDATEDNKESLEEDVQKIIDRFNKIVEEKTKIKETELMSI